MVLLALSPVALFVGLGLSGGTDASDERLDFKRPTDLAIRITVQENHSLREGRVGIKRGDSEEEALPVEVAIDTDLTAIVVDEVRAEGAGLRRSFQNVGGEVSAGARGLGDDIIGPTVELVSRLVGRGVAFVPNEGAPHGFARHYDTAREAQESLLPRLEPPTDWSGLLPPEGVSGQTSGDTWEIEPSALRSILAPCGYLARKGKSQDDAVPLDRRIERALENGVGANLQLLFEGEIEGTARATVTAVQQDRREGNIALVEIEFELKSECDRTDALRTTHELPPGEPAADVLSAALHLGLKGTARLRWSTEVQRPAGVEITADETVEFVVGLVDEDQLVSVETLSLKGTFSGQAKIEDALLIGSERER